MENNPTVSIVMPVYNTAEYLREAIESIRTQTLADFELIAIDDGSTDGSGDMLDSYQQLDSRVRVIHQENVGVVASLNRGIGLAGGQYIARMDSDDISLPERLAKQVGFMEAHPEVGICGTACRRFGDASGVTLPKTQSEDIKSWLLFGPCMAHPTVVMRRDLIIQHNLYYNPDFKQAEDYDLWLRFSHCCEMANIPEPLLLYRVRDKQATTEFRPEVCRWSGLVHKEAIEALGIDASEDELLLHVSIHSLAFEKSRDYVERVEAWLLKLLDANERASVYDSNALARVTFEVWRCLLAYESELGLWMWGKFRRSRLFAVGRRASGQSAVSLALGFLRSQISGALETTSLGRTSKRFIRKLAISR